MCLLETSKLNACLLFPLLSSILESQLWYISEQHYLFYPVLNPSSKKVYVSNMETSLSCLSTGKWSEISKQPPHSPRKSIL